MSELEPQMQSSDPIGALHKMSMTAGVATQDYVAINSFAVAAAVLGVATSLAFVGVFFLIIGLTALICGVWSLWKIHTSNGTQGGKGLAWLGIVLSVVFAGTVLANHIRQQHAESAEARKVTQLVKQFGDFIVAGNYPAAYALLDPEFKARVTLDQFIQVWTNQQAADRFGPLREMYGNDCVQFSPPIGDGGLMAYTYGILHFQNYRDRDRRLTMAFQKSPEGAWRVNQMAELFEPRRRSQRAAQPQ